MLTYSPTPLAPAAQLRGAADTWIDPEEYAYPAGSLRRSRRFARVLCSDGKLRCAKLGVADTFFSIPATLRVGARHVSGSVFSREHPATDSPLFYFVAKRSGRNADALPEGAPMK